MRSGRIRTDLEELRLHLQRNVKHIKREDAGKSWNFIMHHFFGSWELCWLLIFLFLLMIRVHTTNGASRWPELRVGPAIYNL